MPPKRSSKAHAAKAVKKKAAAEEEDLELSHSGEESEEELEDEPADDTEDVPEEDEAEEGDEEVVLEDESVQAGTKRKSPPTNGSESSRKQQRQETSSSANGSKTVNSKKMLNFLISKDAIPYCYPEDELSAAREGNLGKTYSLTPPNLFTPFEHLVTALLLSKPLSHTLGMRSVRTLLNEPYGFSTPGKMHAAGEHEIWEALEKARTQHRQKTATQLFQLAEQYKDTANTTDEGGADDSDAMHKLLEMANDGGPQATIEHVKKSINGLGDVGAQIFCRRVQACDGWGKALWPFADRRSLDSVRQCGIEVEDADELQELIERHLNWDKIGTMGFDKEKQAIREQDGEVQVGVEFVTLLERAIGCVLEGKVEDLKEQVG